MRPLVDHARSSGRRAADRFRPTCVPSPPRRRVPGPPSRTATPPSRTVTTPSRTVTTPRHAVTAASRTVTVR